MHVIKKEEEGKVRDAVGLGPGRHDLSPSEWSMYEALSPGWTSTRKLLEIALGNEPLNKKPRSRSTLLTALGKLRKKGWAEYDETRAAPTEPLWWRKLDKRRDPPQAPSKHAGRGKRRGKPQRYPSTGRGRIPDSPPVRIDRGEVDERTLLALNALPTAAKLKLAQWLISSVGRDPVIGRLDELKRVFGG